MRSDPGDYIGNDSFGVGEDYYFAGAAGDSFVLREANGGVLVDVTGSGLWFGLAFAAPGGAKLSPGEYHDATRFPFQLPGAPGLDVGGNGKGCTVENGSFTVIEATYGGDGAIQRFEATFEQHCHGRTAAIRGHVRAGISEPVPPYQPEPPIPASIAIDSDFGDYVAKGESYLHRTVRGEAIHWYRDRGFIHTWTPEHENWSIDFNAPDGAQLVAGHYGNPQESPFQDQGRPGLSIRGNGAGCNDIDNSNFTVHDVHYNAVGQPDRLHVSFEQRCAGSDKALRGELRIGTPDLSADPVRVTRSWGLGMNGVLGTGLLAASPTAARLTTPNQFRQVAAGMLHSVAVTEEGGVEAWGYNGLGQLGTGSTADQHRPVKVALTGVTQVSAGFLHSVALTEDGTVWTWGHNGLGQLGVGNGVDQTVPRKIPGLTGVTQIAAGGYHSLALKEDGTVWAWGYNGLGMLGDGSLETRYRPVQVQGLAGASQIAGGGFHSLARMDDGTVRSWGWNAFGQLGDGTRTDRQAPVRVRTIWDIRMVSAGMLHSHALYDGGDVLGWGSNAFGQVGDTTTADRLAPSLVACRRPGAYFCGGRAISISSGAYHTVAQTLTEDLYSWGWNAFGQLGDGTTDTRLRPVKVPLVKGVESVSAGWLHTLAISWSLPAGS